MLVNVSKNEVKESSVLSLHVLLWAERIYDILANKSFTF